MPRWSLPRVPGAETLRRHESSPGVLRLLSMKTRLRWLLYLLLAAGLLRVPAVARAQEEHGRTVAAEPASHGGHAEEEKPPLLSFDPGAAVWSIVVFVLLLALLRKFAWKPILEGLQQRETFIHDSIEAAKRQQKEAEETLRRYTEQINRAREDATAIVEEGRRAFSRPAPSTNFAPVVVPASAPALPVAAQTKPVPPPPVPPPAPKPAGGLQSHFTTVNW